MTRDKSEYLQNWLFRADEDMAVMNNLVKSGANKYTSTICFHAHQAVEKYLKAFLVYHDVDFPRTHDLDFLLIECRKIDEHAFDINLKSLTDYGVSVRYPDDFFIPDITETLQYQAIADNIKNIVKERVII